MHPLSHRSPLYAMVAQSGGCDKASITEGMRLWFTRGNESNTPGSGGVTGAPRLTPLTANSRLYLSHPIHNKDSQCT